MMQKLTLAIAVTALIVALGTATIAVSAAAPASFLTSGSTRYAAASGSSTLTTTSTSWVNMGFSKSFTIPSGKHGDVMIFFCGQVFSDDVMNIAAEISKTSSVYATQPAAISLQTGSQGQSRCSNFYATGVAAGTWTVKMRWEGGGGTQTISTRSMIIIVNVY